MIEGWGQHYTRWVFLVLLNEKGDEGIEWPEGLKPLFRAADQVDLRKRFHEVYNQEPGSVMSQEFDVWLILSSFAWGMKLHPELEAEGKRLREEEEEENDAGSGQDASAS